MARTSYLSIMMIMLMMDLFRFTYSFSFLYHDGCLIRSRNCLPFACTCFLCALCCPLLYVSVLCFSFHPAFCVIKVAIISGLSILDCLFCFLKLRSIFQRGNEGPSCRNCMVVGVTTTYVISVYHHQGCEFESRSWRVVLSIK